MRTNEELWHKDIMDAKTLEGTQIEHLKHIFAVLLDIRDLLSAPKEEGNKG